MRQTVVILCGFPFSGKSVLVPILQRYLPEASTVSRDNIRVSLNGGSYPRTPPGQRCQNASLEALVTKLEIETFWTALKAGHHVIIDATNLRKKRRKTLRNIAWSLDPRIRVIILWVKTHYPVTARRSYTEEEWQGIIQDMTERFEPPKEYEAEVVVVDDPITVESTLKGIFAENNTKD